MFRRNPEEGSKLSPLPVEGRSYGKPKIKSMLQNILKKRKMKENKEEKNIMDEVKKPKGKKAKKVAKKVAKKAKKKASEKKAMKSEKKEVAKKVRNKKTAKKVAKKVAKKATKEKVSEKKASKKKAKKKVSKKKNPLFGLVGKKKKAKKKKVSKKKASKKKAKKVRVKVKTNPKRKKKKLTKKALRAIRRKAARKAAKTRKRLAKAGYKKVDQKKIRELKKKLKAKRYKAKGNPYKKTKHKRKFNPGGIMKKKFEDLTKHQMKEAGGLFAGGALIKIYDHHLKQRFLAPMLNPIMAKLGAAAPAADALIDVLASVLIGQGLSMIGKKAKLPALDVAGKGLIGASVVQLGVKSIASVSSAVGMPMNGIIGVPSMSGIIGVPSMSGIIATPSMGAYGYGADFQGLGATGMTDADFGAYQTVGLEGSYLQKADYDSGGVIPMAPRNPGSLTLGGYENVEYSDDGEDADF
jgi:adenylate kinase/ribonuclease R